MYHLLNVKVFASDREVIRRIRMKMREPCRNDPTMRELRKEAYKSLLVDHHRAQEIYREIYPNGPPHTHLSQRTKEVKPRSKSLNGHARQHGDADSTGDV